MTLTLAATMLPFLAPGAATAGDRAPLQRPASLQPGSVHTSTASNRVIVKYRTPADASARVRSLAADGLRVRRTLSLTGAKVIDVPQGRTATDVVADLSKDPAVEYAVPDVLRKPLAAAPNDPFFDQQWGLLNLGLPLDASAQAPTPLAGIDVDAPGAWAVARGSSAVTVAVIDQGIAIGHPDLQGAIWTNPGEIAGNGRDDDANGKVDDVHGWDFVRSSGAVDSPLDDDSHGTHVAGIIGATRDNDEGVVGLAAGVNVMSLKFMSDDGGYDSDAIDAIAYAKSKGVKVMNASWGASLGEDPGAADPALRDAISECGCVFVAAAGNDGVSSDTGSNRVYPASFGLPNEISVAALDDRGQLATFSNYGSTVDLAAPGDAILSTLPTQSGGYGYGWGGGTSMAAPFVTATAALMLSAAPALTPAEVVSRIKASVQPLSSLTGRVSTGGMLDAGAAMRTIGVVQPERLSGADRYSTAAKVASKFAPGVAVAYVASGESFPDALAGAALAGSQDAPVLLTGPRSLPTVTVTALDRLKPSRIVVLGGTGAVSSAVASQLASHTSGKVTRIAGGDRYATASAIAQSMMQGVSTDTVYVASGESFPDALAGAALAGSTGQPVLLTSPTSLPSATAQRLSTLGPDRIVVLGGSAAVSSAVATRLADYTSGSVTRLAGTDRYATAAAVAKKFGTGVRAAYVASGLDFPDALAGAALAGSQDSPVLLTGKTSVPSSTRTALTTLVPGSVIVLGGTGVVSTATASALGAYGNH